MYKEVAENLYAELCPGCPQDIPDALFSLVKGHYIHWEQIPHDLRVKDFDFYIRLMLTEEPISKENILLCLQWGCRVTHVRFEPEEFIERSKEKPKLYQDENSLLISPTLFWNHRKGPEWETDWFIFKKIVKSKKQKDDKVQSRG